MRDDGTTTDKAPRPEEEMGYRATTGDTHSRMEHTVVSTIT